MNTREQGTFLNAEVLLTVLYAKLEADNFFHVILCSMHEDSELVMFAHHPLA